MAFSRNSLAAAVAGTLSLAVLTGCPAPNPAPVPSTGASSTPAPGASATPAPGTSTEPSNEPGASVAPSALPSATPLVATTLRGKVYDLDGAAISSGAKVTVKSLNTASPFESTVDVISGSYVVNSVPSGVQLEITAVRTGWTTRTRVETLLPLTSTQPNIVNFGGVDNADTEGKGYFISKYPEISSVEPADDAEGVDPNKLTVKLTLSEPLDSTNQNRFANAIRVWPVNTQAGGFATANFEDNTLPGVITIDNNPTVVKYVVKQGSIYATDDANRATVTWDAAGQVATLTFNAPLQTGKSDPGAYNIGLVASSEAIKDNDNNFLGTNNTNALNTNSASGDLIRNVFRERDLSATGTTAAELWASTHDDVSSFETAKDETAPTLQGVSVVEVSGKTRLQLTFSEPMAVFAGSGVLYADPSVSDLNAYTFAVAEKASGLTDLDLEGVNPVVATTAAKFDEAQAEREFKFTTGGAAGATVVLSPTDPKTVRIELVENYFQDKFTTIKARAQGVKDPAGNNITKTQADAQVKTGNL